MEEYRINQDDDMVEIDLMELVRAFRRRLWIIILAGIIGCGLAGAYSKFLITPQYRSTAMLYILSKETTLTSLADLQIGSQLTADYKVIVSSRPVLEETVEKLELDMTYRDLLAKITINNPSSTRILTVTAEDPNPEMAKKIADTVAETASDYIGDIMEMIPPKLFETGEIPTVKSSPSNSKNALLGGMVGAALVCVLTVMEVLMNDTVTTEEDVARYLGIPVLASVPEREHSDDDVVSTPSKSRKKKKRGKRG